MNMTDEQITKNKGGRPKSNNPKGKVIWVAAEFLPTITAILEMLKTAKENLRR